MYKRERTTLEDVAREAGVSLATVDRVLNDRPGVREGTVRQVRGAMARLGYRPDPLAARLARGTEYRFAFMLPVGSNPFMQALDDQLALAAEWLASERASIERVFVDVFDPAVLAAAIERLDGNYDGVAIVALDHPLVRAAIDGLVEHGVGVVTLVSDVPSSKRLRFVGIDNSAAGRTAATLMGRFAAGRRGPVGVIAGSLALRDHAERLYGFAQVLTTEYPLLTNLACRETQDDPARCKAEALAILAEHPDLVGLYNAGAGNEGIAEALAETGRGSGIIVLCHELTQENRHMLVHGMVDAVIAQSPGHEVRSAARLLLANAMSQPILLDQERIRVEIFVRDNLP